ncbi:MAG: nucleotide sugar dehydrogenase [Haloarculaceae archaeon]
MEERAAGMGGAGDPGRSECPVAVVGLGYVGTSLAAVLAEGGHAVRGVDVDASIVDRVTDADCPIEEEGITGRFERYAEEGRITASTDPGTVADCPTVLVTVGTPLSAADPDLSSVESATEDIAPHVGPENLVVYRSTLPATATEETIAPLLAEGSGLEPGVDFHLAFCPERMAEGSAYEDLTTAPVVVGGVSAGSREAAESFWSSFGLETVPVSDPTAAELAKLADNWWIDLSIALANELALLSEKLGTDAIEVIEAANTLPKGQHNVNILYPGAGVGGSCLHKDPWFVARLGEEYGLDLETPRVSRRANDRMPGHVVDLTREALGGDLAGATVAVLGVAFKGGTDDTRNTPAVPVVEGLREAGADLRVTDSSVPADEVEELLGIAPERLPETLDGADAVVIVTDHDAYRALTPETLRERVGRDSFAVVDGRHVFAWDAFDGTGVSYRGVGRGVRE